jgi:hypothetical protein
MVDLVDVYNRYYLKKPKNSLTPSGLALHEGFAEFVKQHLLNPKKMTKKYPELTAKVL